MTPHYEQHVEAPRGAGCANGRDQDQRTRKNTAGAPRMVEHLKRTAHNQHVHVAIQHQSKRAVINVVGGVQSQ